MGQATPVRILIADDQADILDALRMLLGDEGYEVTPARSPGEALERLEGSEFDLAILDLNYTRDTTSGQEGLDLMERIRAIDPTLPVLVVTAWSSVSGAVEAMRRGARDYIEKPWDDEPSARRSTCGGRCDAASGSRKRTPGSSAAPRPLSSATPPPFSRCARRSNASRRPTPPC
jgi:DNA-binding NtrC family response regulator